MIYVVIKDTMDTLISCDACEVNGYERMHEWCADYGWRVVEEKITPMGDMVIFVTC